MELSPDIRKDDEGGARASASSSPSGEADDNKEPSQQQQQRAREDDADDDEGTRQPYKCTFCRRGFPSAQALGGHMNVHRRHRGRPAAPAQGGISSCYDQPCSTAPVLAFALATTTTRHPVAPLRAEQRKPCELPLFGRGDCAAGRRNREGGGTAVGEDRYLAKLEGGGREEELDLELRLGGAGS